ncbi:MAG: hypothetical protein MZW92_01965 [Comamonadaceae bacterium]|nr:hypothetical protein [Comamonadaceae bacterium]
MVGRAALPARWSGDRRGALARRCAARADAARCARSAGTDAVDGARRWRCGPGEIVRHRRRGGQRAARAACEAVAGLPPAARGQHLAGRRRDHPRSGVRERPRARARARPRGPAGSAGSCLTFCLAENLALGRQRRRSVAGSALDRRATAGRAPRELVGRVRRARRPSPWSAPAQRSRAATSRRR